MSETNFTRRRFLAVSAAVVAGGASSLSALQSGSLAGNTKTTKSIAFSRTGSPARPPTRRPRTREEMIRAAAHRNAVTRVNTDQPFVALTFDDGPDPAYTSLILDLLEERNVRATFFVVGINALEHNELFLRQVEAGHTIANHTHSHVDLRRLRPDEIAYEITGGNSDLVAAGAPKPELFRPPRGHTNAAIAEIADSQHDCTVFWDVALERQITNFGVELGSNRALSQVKAGSIILAHDGGHTNGQPVINRTSTLTSLPLLLDGLERKGLQLVDLPTLLKLNQPGSEGQELSS